LYQYDAFIEFIKTLPGYEQYVKKLHKKISTMAWYKKCIGNIKGKHYWGFTDRVKQLHADVQHEKRIHKKEQLSHISFSKNSDIPHFSCEQVIIHALNTSDNQFILANQLDFLMQDLFDNALMHNISVHTDLEICIEATINTIRYATNPYQCAFNAAFINHIAYEIEDRIAKNDLKITQKKQNMNLFSRALEQFITRLNPVTQIKNSCEFLVDAACFIADITLGKLYLTKEQYQLRKDNFWSTIDSLSPSKLKLLSNEQLVDLVAHCAADCVFSFGIFKVANYVKNMQRISKINQRISTITQQLTHVVDGALNEKPILITSEGVIIGSAENMQQAGILAQEVIRDSRMLLESIEKGLLASIKPELNELNHIFDEIH